jgi:hypothetical protein
MMSSYLKIEKMANGYEVCLRDPEIEKANHKSDGPWKDPEVEFVFTDEDEMLAFVKKAMKKLTSGGEYDTAFAKAMMEEKDVD